MSKESPVDDIVIGKVAAMGEGLVAVDVTLKNVWVDAIPPRVMNILSGHSGVGLYKSGGYHRGGDIYYRYILICPPDTNLDIVKKTLHEWIFASPAQLHSRSLK